MLYALDVKTSYSMLSSLIKIDDLTEKAKELGYFSLAITDTNNMFGTYEFYLSCIKKGIKPIIGIKLEYNENKFILNADLIETIEETPDTVITLVSGKKIIVKESRQEVKNLVLSYKKAIFAELFKLG